MRLFIYFYEKEGQRNLSVETELADNRQGDAFLAPHAHSRSKKALPPHGGSAFF